MTHPLQLVPSSQKRPGISDLMATVLLVAMTLIAGSALFGYVNGQAATSENSIGAANAANVNFLNEKFMVPQLTFKYSNPTNQITVFVYNNGQLTDVFVEIEVYTIPRSSMDLLYYTCSSSTSQTFTICKLPNPPNTTLSGDRVLDLNNVNNNNCYGAATSLEAPTTLQTFAIPKGGIAPFTLTLPSLPSPCVNGAFTATNFYYVQLIGQYGNSVTYFQAM